MTFNILIIFILHILVLLIAIIVVLIVYTIAVLIAMYSNATYDSVINSVIIVYIHMQQLIFVCIRKLFRIQGTRV